MTSKGNVGQGKAAKKELKRQERLAKQEVQREDRRQRKHIRDYEKEDPLYVRFINSSESYQSEFISYAERKFASNFTGYNIKQLEYTGLAEVVESIVGESEQKTLDVLVIQHSEDIQDYMKDKIRK